MMARKIEIERRFLLKYFPPGLAKCPSVFIEDIRILTGEVHPHLRLRRFGDEYMLTKKYPVVKGGLKQMAEETIVLNKAEFHALKKLPHTRQGKRRYFYPYRRLIGEIDIWTGRLRGLAIIEFEFRSKKEAQQFAMPEFCLAEITREEWLSTGELAGKSYKDIRTKISTLGYLPLFFRGA